MDGKILKANESYDKLPNTWVIFITSFDPFGEKRMVYTIKNRCVEVPDIEYEDGATTLFLYVTGESDDVSKDLKELLRYIRNTTPENAVNSKLKEIQEGIEYIKTESSVREAYMTLDEYIKSEVEEEVKAQVQEQVKKKVEEQVKKKVEEQVKKQVDAVRADAASKIADARADADNARADAAETKRKLLSAEAEIEELKAKLKKHLDSDNSPDIKQPILMMNSISCSRGLPASTATSGWPLFRSNLNHFKYNFPNQ